MAKLCFILAALFVFATIAYAHAEPLPSFDLARSERWLMEKNVRTGEMVEEGPTEVTEKPPGETEQTGGFLQFLKNAVFFIPIKILEFAQKVIISMLKFMK